MKSARFQRHTGAVWVDIEWTDITPGHIVRKSTNEAADEFDDEAFVVTSDIVELPESEGGGKFCCQRLVGVKLPGSVPARYGALRVWANDVTDWVIATSQEAAVVTLKESYGELDDDYPLDFTQVDAQHVLPLDMDGTIITHTAAEWALIYGKACFLGSTEY